MKSYLTLVALFLSIHGTYADVKTELSDILIEEIVLSTEREGEASVSNAESAEVINTEHQKEDLRKHEEDSSEYSVNKFNYLFYLIYKVKYMDMDEEPFTEIGVQ